MGSLTAVTGVMPRDVSSDQGNGESGKAFFPDQGHCLCHGPALMRQSCFVRNSRPERPKPLRGENFSVRKVRELRAPLCCCVFPVSPEAPLLVLERVEPPPGRFHLRQSTYAVESQQVNDLHHAFLNLYRNLCISDTPSGQFVLQKHQVIFPEAVL